MSHFWGILPHSENIDVLGLKDNTLNGGSSRFKAGNVVTYQTNQLVLVDRVNPLKTRTIANCKIAFLVNLSHTHGKR